MHQVVSNLVWLLSGSWCERRKVAPASIDSELCEATSTWCCPLHGEYFYKQAYARQGFSVRVARNGYFFSCARTMARPSRGDRLQDANKLYLFVVTRMDASGKNDKKSNDQVGVEPAPYSFLRWSGRKRSTGPMVDRWLTARIAVECGSASFCDRFCSPCEFADTWYLLRYPPPPPTPVINRFGAATEG